MYRLALRCLLSSNFFCHRLYFPTVHPTVQARLGRVWIDTAKTGNQPLTAHGVQMGILAQPAAVLLDTALSVGCFVNGALTKELGLDSKQSMGTGEHQT